MPPVGDGSGGALHDGTLPPWQFPHTEGELLRGLPAMRGALFTCTLSHGVCGIVGSSVAVVDVICLGTGWIAGFGVARLLSIWSLSFGCPGSHLEPGRFSRGGLVNWACWFCFFSSVWLLGAYDSGFLLSPSGFPSSFSSLCFFADFGSMFGGGHFVRGVGDLSFGPFGCEL